MTELPSRRIFFQGLGALGVAVALAGCGVSATPSATVTPPRAGDVLVATGDVPIGGGVILTDRQIVVTQPTSGEFKAFSAMCTHAGNTVTSVSDGTIHCAYHGSEFSASTGQNIGGPAPSPLAEVEVTVAGDNVVAA